MHDKVTDLRWIALPKSAKTFWRWENHPFFIYIGRKAVIFNQANFTSTQYW